jgi:hypothetical protein
MNPPDSDSDVYSNPPPNPKAEKDIAWVLLQSIDPLVEQIKTLLVDFVLQLRKQLLSGDQFLPVRKAARITEISVPTLYVWINKSVINHLFIDGKTYVSISEVKFAKQTIYQPARATKGSKATKRPGGKPKVPSESKPQPEIQVRDGLPYFPDLRGESKGDSVEPY